MYARPPTYRHHDLNAFDLSDMIECGRAVRRVAENATSMEMAARRTVEWLHTHLIDVSTGQRSCLLARCFLTQRFEHLPPDLAEIAAGARSRAEIDPRMPVLTLLATAGEEPAWNDRRSSRGHAAIPLESVTFVERAPMIASLLRQMGLEIGAALNPTAALILDSEQHAFNVFHVANALGDPSIPAQEEFVRPFGVRSVLGFGGIMPSGELFAIILFSRTPIPRQTADLFRTIALGVKLALLPFTRAARFDGEMNLPPASRPRRTDGPFGETEEDQVRAEIATLQLLIPALEDAALYQTRRLKAAFADLQRREEEVREQGRRLSAMLEATSDAVFLIDREWRFTFINRYAVELIANGRDLLNTNLFDAFPAAEGTAFVRNYRKVMYERASVQFQEYYPEPLNKWFEVHASPSQDGVAVFFRDVTERLRTEASLRQAEKLAATGRMAASIAHEINNPLEAVTNLLYLTALDPGLTDVGKSYVHEAESELRRVSEITTHMLRFYRQSTNPSAVDLCDVLESVLVLFNGRLTRAGIEVIKQFLPAQPLTGYAGELRQIFANLVGNALDAMPSAGGRLMLRVREAHNLRGAGRGLRITVADTGCGMSAATRDRIFEPFFSTKGNTGTGLGLWVSHELIGKHQGRVRVRSREAHTASGTVFALFFPFAAATVAASEMGGSPAN